MQRSAGSHLKKVFAISIFIFLFGLFSGLFFSIGMSEGVKDDLSSSFISSITDESIGHARILLSSLFSNYMISALMLTAALSNMLCFLPFTVLWCRSFAIGFCSGLIHISGTESPVVLSLTELLPPSMFFIPGFILLAAASYVCSRNEILKSKRPSSTGKSLISLILISLAVVTAGCIVETICHLL